RQTKRTQKNQEPGRLEPLPQTVVQSGRACLPAEVTSHQKGRSKPTNLPGFNAKIRRTMNWDDEVRAGTQGVKKVDIEDLPWLKAAEDDKKVFVAVCGKHTTSSY